MLARANRVVRPEDFRAIVRRGRRTASTSAVYYRLEREDASPARFGFIVSRAVGGAVDRWTAAVALLLLNLFPRLLVMMLSGGIK